MKRLFISPIFFLMTLFLFQMPMAHAVKILSPADLALGPFFGKLKPNFFLVPSYEQQLASCRIQIERLEDDYDRERDIFWEEAVEYDERWDLADCIGQQDSLENELNECRASASSSGETEETSTSSSDSDDTETESSSSFSDDWHVLIDYLINGTCDAPRNDRMRDRCLENCRAEVTYWREWVERYEEKNRDVRGTLEEYVEECREEVQELEEELEECRTSTPADPDRSSVPPVTPHACGATHCS